MNIKKTTRRKKKGVRQQLRRERLSALADLIKPRFGKRKEQPLKLRQAQQARHAARKRRKASA
jgi:hypothetical protein